MRGIHWVLLLDHRKPSQPDRPAGSATPARDLHTTMLAAWAQSDELFGGGPSAVAQDIPGVWMSGEDLAGHTAGVAGGTVSGLRA